MDLASVIGIALALGAIFEAAGLRAGVLLAGLMAVERVLLPVGILLLGSGRRRDDRPPG
jgi:hypothetical protein